MMNYWKAGVIGMAEGIKKNEKRGRDVYPDIFNLPHHQSPTRPHMSLYDRSAQFASYKALSGYEDMVAEEARETDTALELEESDLELLSQKLSLISDVVADGEHPALTFTVFVPDTKKAGGKYVEITDGVKKVDAVNRKIVLMSMEGRGHMNKTIDFEKISAIRGKLVDYMDDAMWDG